MKSLKSTNKTLIAVLLALAMLAGMFCLSGCGEDEETDDNDDAVEQEEGEATDGESSDLSVETLSYKAAEKALVSGAMSNYSTLEKLGQVIQDYAQKTDNSNDSKATITFSPESAFLALLGITETQVNPTVLDVNAGLSGDSIYSGITYKNGNKEIISGDVWITDESIIMQVPQLTEKYLYTDFAAFDEMYNEMYDEGEEIGMNMGDYYSTIIDMMQAEAIQAVPAEAAVNDILNAVLDEYFSLTENLPAESGGEVDVNGTKIVTEKTTVEITDEMVLKLALVALNKVKESDEIKDYAKQMVDLMVPDQDMSSMVDMMIEGAIATFEEELQAITEPEIGVIMDVYVGDAQVVKRVITFPDGSGEEFVMLTHKTADDLYCDFVMDLDGEKIQVTVSAVLQSGAYNVTVSGLEGVDKIELSGVSKNDDLTCAVSVGGAKYVTVEVASSTNPVIKPAPELDASNSIDLTDESQLELVSLEIAEATMVLAANLDNNGVYDIIGLSIQQMGALMGGMGGLDLGDIDLDEYGLGDYDLADFDVAAAAALR